MKLSLFIGDTPCTSRQHCIACRSPIDGKQMRTIWAQVYETGAGSDFNCPWGFTLEKLRDKQCSRCGGQHDIKNCQIPEGYDPRDYAMDSKGTEPCNC